MIQCAECWKALATSKDKLLERFFATVLVDLRDRGGFRWVTPDFCLKISAVEKIVDGHFDKAEGYVKDSFEDVICKLASLKLPCVWLETQRKTLIPKLVVVIRYRFKARHRKYFLLSKIRAQRHSIMKIWKWISTKIAEPLVKQNLQPKAIKMSKLVLE